MSTITLTDKQRRIATVASFHQIKALEAEPSSGFRDSRLKDAQELQEILVPTRFMTTPMRSMLATAHPPRPWY